MGKLSRLHWKLCFDGNVSGGCELCRHQDQKESITPHAGWGLSSTSHLWQTYTSSLCVCRFSPFFLIILQSSSPCKKAENFRPSSTCKLAFRSRLTLTLMLEDHKFLCVSNAYNFLKYFRVMCAKWDGTRQTREGKKASTPLAARNGQNEATDKPALCGGCVLSIGELCLSR